MNARPNWDSLDSDKVISEVENLLEGGIDSITLSDYLLIKLIKERYPNLPINVSVIAGIDNKEKALIYDELGVYSINLNLHTANRDLREIEAIATNTDCRIKLISNVSCIDHCRLRDDHYRYVREESSRLKPDPYILWCADKALKDPSNLLKAPFIRPEDIKHYHQLGVDNFKLTDRREPTEALLSVAETYLAQEYHGNLFTLLFRGEQVRKWTSTLGDIPVAPPNIYIDNDKLTEIDFFKNATTLRGNELEGFYRKATEYAVTIDEYSIRVFLKFLDKLRIK